MGQRLRMSEQELLKEFEHIDTDGDGRVSVEELASFLKSIGPQWGNKEKARDLFKKMDKNEDGKIENKEYIGFMQEKDEITDTTSLFSMLDTDESGVVSAAELNHVLTEMGIFLEDEEVDSMMDMADTGGDGKIGLEEFKKFLSETAKTVQRKVHKVDRNIGVSDMWSSVNHMAIVVSDVGRSCAFYGGTLGMEQIMRPDFDRHGAWFTLGNIDLHLIKGRPAVHPDDDLIVGHIALNVGREEDMERLVTRLKTLDVEYRENVSVPNPDSDIGRVKQAFVRDPDGYYLEFCSCDGLHEYLDKRAESQQNTLDVEKINTAIYMRQFLKSWATKAKEGIQVDQTKLANLLARQKVYGDITQSASPLQLEELLRIYNNEIPTVIKALKEIVAKQGGRNFIPPAFFERDRTFVQPPAFKVGEKTK